MFHKDFMHYVIGLVYVEIIIKIIMISQLEFTFIYWDSMKIKKGFKIWIIIMTCKGYFTILHGMIHYLLHFHQSDIIIISILIL